MHSLEVIQQVLLVFISFFTFVLLIGTLLGTDEFIKSPVPTRIMLVLFGVSISLLFLLRNEPHSTFYMVAGIDTIVNLLLVTIAYIRLTNRDGNPNTVNVYVEKLKKEKERNEIAIAEELRNPDLDLGGKYSPKEIQTEYEDVLG